MNCEEIVVEVPEHRLLAMSGRARKEHVPLSGHVDLTYRCNLRCSHCYAGHLVGRPVSHSGELETAQVVELLTEVAEDGCLFLTLSGGDPLIRPDFVDIYLAAKKLGMVVSVLTNATLVREEHIDVFREYPPQAVDVSVYGSTKNVYERVTRVPGSFRRAMKGLETLLDGGVPVTMKTPILVDNVEDVQSVRALAEGYGVDFRVDSRIMPRIDGDFSPLAQRVDPDTAIGIEMSALETRRDLAEYYERTASVYSRSSAATERLYICGAGVASFYLDPQGCVYPCLFSRSVAYNAVAAGFEEAWKAVSTAVDADASLRPTECVGCTDKFICGYCPALFQLEGVSTGYEERYTCRLGEARRRMMGSSLLEVENAGK